MKKKITQTLLPIVMGLSLIMQFACSDDDKSGGNYNGPLKRQSALIKRKDTFHKHPEIF